MHGRTLRNWNDSASSHPAVIANPRNLDELIGVVKDREKYPSPVTVAGHLHSMNACFETTGTQLLLRQFNDVRVDVDAKTVTVGANVDMIGVRNAVNRQGMQTEVTPEIGNATAGSVACSGTKDASIGSGLGQISSTVVGVKLVNAQAEVETITVEGDPDKLQLIRSSYGLLGVIFEVTFSLQKTLLLNYRYASFPLDRLPTHNRIFDGADGVLAFLLPYSNRLLVERRFLAPEGASISLLSKLKRWLRDKLWENVASWLTTRFHFNRFYYVMDRLILVWILTLHRTGGFRAQRDDSMINFKARRTHYFDFTFWAVPISRWQDYVRSYVEFCKDFERRTGFRCSLPAEVYFMSRDEHSLLSPSPDEAVFTMDSVDTRMNDPLWIEFNRRYNEFAADFGARPLLNQTKQLSRAIVTKTLGANWERFVALRRQYDPDERFLNGFFKELL
jgi:L-gulonolactone oxidase